MKKIKLFNEEVSLAELRTLLIGGTLCLLIIVGVFYIAFSNGCAGVVIG